VAERRGAALVALTIAAGCVEPLLARASGARHVDPSTLLVLRYLVATIVIFAIGERRWVGRAGALRLASAGVLLFVTSGLALVAFVRLPVAIAVTLVSATPLWVAIASARREGLGARFFGALALGIVGIVLTAGPLDLSTDAIGIACALGATGSSAIYRLVIERVGKEYPSPVVSSYVFATGAVLAIAFAPFAPWPDAIAAGTGAIVGVAAAVSNVSFVAAVTALGAARTSLALLLQRPVIIGLAALLLAEPIGLVEGIGVVMVITAVWLARPAPKAKA
jgi:drug/metabolite transporter (DMT)-like permease